ncbi:MAG: hypothetical protein AAF722_05320 [Cyanobacteria bacterium P01_C01_bin.70]
MATLRPLRHRQTGYHSAPIHQGRYALRIRSALVNGATAAVVPRGCVALGARAASAAARDYQGK